ncbi:uncharacterized protein PAC_12721 [Phialocephala subalpina]|uniref:Uncharacterized protein n=1 Tax=Phialocephala subalpina TaxID=576137 RepID=A0A1L7XCR4_9HELO|nr:uncharacterized protein PAC_12721 [Phialocephala subalpina]
MSSLNPEEGPPGEPGKPFTPTTSSTNKIHPERQSLFAQMTPAGSSTVPVPSTPSQTQHQSSGHTQPAAKAEISTSANLSPFPKWSIPVPTAPTTCQGTAIMPFIPLIEKEPNSTSNQQNSFFSVCFQTSYQDFFFEELRLEDYQQNRRYNIVLGRTPKAISASTSNFGGSGNTTNVFGDTSSGAVTPTSTTLTKGFSSANPFPSTTQSPNTTTFSNNSSIPTTAFGFANASSSTIQSPSANNPSNNASNTTSAFGLARPLPSITENPGTIKPGNDTSISTAGPGPAKSLSSMLQSTSAVTSSNKAPNLPSALGLANPSSSTIQSTSTIAFGSNSFGLAGLTGSSVPSATNGIFRDFTGFDNPFIFDGDVKIVAKYRGTKVTGNVSASAMAMASPIWREILYPTQIQTQPQGQPSQPHIDEANRTAPQPTLCSPSAIQEFDFSMDDSEALYILLAITHLKFGKVPKTPDYVDKVAVLCHKYDCVALVGLWLSSWLQGQVLRTLGGCYAHMLFSAWVFGKHNQFNKVGIFMIKNIRTSEGQKCLNHAGLPVNHNLIPGAGTVDRMLNIRQATLEQLLDIIHVPLQKYMTNGGPNCQHGNHNCYYSTLGWLVFSAQSIGAWPRKPAAEIHDSIETVASKIRTLVRPLFHSAAGQNDCFKVNFEQEVARVLQNIPSPMGDSERAHMAEQAKKLEGQ